MKNHRNTDYSIVRIILSAFIFIFVIQANIAFAALKWPTVNDALIDIEAILQTAPDQISEEQYYICERAVILNASGSGGYFLDENEVNWILKMEKYYIHKGVSLKDPNDRYTVIAHSYFGKGLFKKAMVAYKIIGNLGGYEEAEWRFNNKSLVTGKVNIVEYDGPISYWAKEKLRVEDKHYFFVSFFKGPIFRYDKLKNKHAVIYGPGTYEWSDKLEWDGRKLKIQLRLGSEEYIFDNEASTIQHIDKLNTN